MSTKSVHAAGDHEATVSHTVLTPLGGILDMLTRLLDSGLTPA